MRSSQYLWITCALGAILAPLALSVSAAPSSLAEFLHTRRALAATIDQAALLPTAQQAPGAFIGHVFEIPATVSGLMSSDGHETVMLTDSAQVTVSARVPVNQVGEPWLSDTGYQVRALVKVESDGNSQSLSNLTLVAAAPEADVEQAEEHAERLIADRQHELAARLSRRPSFPSRSLPYQRVAPLTGGEEPVVLLPPAALRVYPAYRNAIHHLNPNLSSVELDTITTYLLGFSDEYKVDPRLVIAMMIAESGFHLTATSCTGAMGLGQLMPGTARGLGVTNAYDPVQNIEGSIRLLKEHLDQYGGKISLTMAAYNAGQGAVSKYHGVPPYQETQQYVVKVASLYRQLCGK